MNRQRTAVPHQVVLPAHASTVLLLDQAHTTSLTARGAMEDAGLQVVPRRSFDQLRGLLQHGSHSMVVVAVDEIGTDQVDTVARVRALTEQPIFVVSETKNLEMRCKIFEAGADEHIAPSTGRAEITARIRAKLRRCARTPEFSGSRSG